MHIFKNYAKFQLKAAAVAKTYCYKYLKTQFLKCF